MQIWPEIHDLRYNRARFAERACAIRPSFEMPDGRENLSIDLDGAVEEAYPEMIRLRRDIHRRPELAFQEVRTASLVADRLRALGLEVKTGLSKTGVVGLLKGEGKGKTLLIRADMDALPIDESGALDFSSENPGAMHA